MSTARYECEIGPNADRKTVTDARIVEEFPGSDYVRIEFSHPTMRRMTGRMIINRKSLRQVST